MKIAQLKQEQSELEAYLQTQPWNVFGTLKFINGRTIGRATAHLLLRSYWNKIDSAFFGKAAERQRVRVPRWCFAHEGSDSENFHVHFVLLAPIANTEHVCTVLNAVWAQHHQQTAPLPKNWILPVQDRTAVTKYLTREYWRMGSATLLDDISWSHTTAEKMAAFEHAAQADRIDRAVTSSEISAARHAFMEQRDKYTR
jgi:hypothetical protein